MLPSRSDVDVGLEQLWAITYDPSKKEVRVYKNGKLDVTHSPVDVGDMSNDTPPYIGYSETWAGYFKGSIRDVMIFNRALSADEIVRTYSSQKWVFGD